ncbi:MAG: Dabb family protein [Clostridiales bacterium]|nr:Dabb family protein [Clostridiales bacterium]
MIKHIVCFKLKDNSRAECEKAADILMSMQGNVALLRGIEVGVDFLHSSRSYDIILQVVLDDKAALDKYQNDEYHCNVVKAHMHAVTQSSVAVDYVI